jgi:hypothetical protein
LAKRVKKATQVIVVHYPAPSKNAVVVPGGGTFFAWGTAATGTDPSIVNVGVERIEDSEGSIGTPGNYYLALEMLAGYPYSWGFWFHSLTEDTTYTIRIEAYDGIGQPVGDYYDLQVTIGAKQE